MDNSGYTVGYTLSRGERLRGDKRIRRLFTGGKSGFAFPFRYYYVLDEMRDGAPPVSMLVSVPKKMFKRAVKRNLLKRRTREAFRLNKGALADKAAAAGMSVSIAFVFSSKDSLDYAAVCGGVKRALSVIGGKLDAAIDKGKCGAGESEKPL